MAQSRRFTTQRADQLRGPQHDAAWCDELAKWRYARETWDILQFGLRLGENPRQVITTTPRPIPIVRDLLAREGHGVSLTRGTTSDNRANLAQNYFETIVKQYEGTRLGRQELNAELVDHVAGSLWTRAILNQHRVAGGKPPPPMQRVVVGIDPAAKASATEIEPPKPKSSLPDWVMMGGDTCLMIYRAVCRPEDGPQKPSQPLTGTRRTPWWSR